MKKVVVVVLLVVKQECWLKLNEIFVFYVGVCRDLKIKLVWNSENRIEGETR